MKALALLPMLVASLASAGECPPLPYDLMGKTRAEVMKQLPKLEPLGAGLAAEGFHFYCLASDLLVTFTPDGTVNTLVSGFSEAGSPQEAARWKQLASLLQAELGPSKGVKKTEKYSYEDFSGPHHTTVKLMGLGPHTPLQVVVQKAP